MCASLPASTPTHSLTHSHIQLCYIKTKKKKKKHIPSFPNTVVFFLFIGLSIFVCFRIPSLIPLLTLSLTLIVSNRWSWICGPFTSPTTSPEPPSSSETPGAAARPELPGGSEEEESKTVGGCLMFETWIWIRSRRGETAAAWLWSEPPGRRTTIREILRPLLLPVWPFLAGNLHVN